MHFFRPLVSIWFAGLIGVMARSDALAAEMSAFAHVPASAPRTLVPAGRTEAFRAYVTTGEGAAGFARLKEDFDREWMDFPFPAEPLTYGDPEPQKRDTDKADKWRAAQDTCGRVAGVAEAGALLWLGTGEARYRDKAKAFLLQACEWSLDGSGWEKGPGPGATAIEYNDEAHFRLWRKLPQVFDLLRAELTPEQRAHVLGHLRERGERSVTWIRAGRVEKAEKNSLAGEPASHPIRFMAMTGLAGLALWDDLPGQARDWWSLSYGFYRDRFPSWGGDDGGWGEGIAYWRGVMEHAAFQDALLAIGDPLAYDSAFWRNTPYFQIYHVQPYRHTGFGDLSNAGKFTLEPRTAEFLRHLARVNGDGHLVAYADLMRGKNENPAEAGLKDLDRSYPTSAEFLIRNFTAAGRPVPAAAPLDGLPASRWFRDIGWVSMHSALGRPDDDIHVMFKSSPYGSFSHSHADQNAFILNAYGENLAINSGYREFHRSPHHKGWTWQTKSKNALLIDGEGQAPQDMEAAGRITVYDTGVRFTRATGDATAAYRAGRAGKRVESVVRDLVFIDQRYLVIRDRVRLATPGRLSWLLHAERPIEWDADKATAVIFGEKATLTTTLLAPAGAPGWTGTNQEKFDVPVDAKYTKGGEAGTGGRGAWGEQSHLRVDTNEGRTEHLVYAVLWPERDGRPARPLETRIEGRGGLRIARPDGKTDLLMLDETTLTLE